MDARKNENHDHQEIGVSVFVQVDFCVCRKIVVGIRNL